MTITESQGTYAAESAKTLAQIVAAEKGTKSRTNTRVSALYKDIQKTSETSPMRGLSRTYQPRFEDGAQLPEEYRRVQFSAESKLDEFVSALRGLMDVTATKDVANTKAKATVKVGDVVIIEDAPVPLLLSLDKQLTDLRSFISELPVLDPAVEWTYNPDAGAYASRPVGTIKTEKVRKSNVIVPATERHPAQVDVVNEDVVVGYWTKVEYSGFVDGNRVKQLLDRVDRLILAVKYAREEANSMQATETVHLGGAVASYILG